MSIIQDLTPINLQEEKQKFFDNDCKYNPQFKYKTLATVGKIYKYGKPKPEYLELAKKILKTAFENNTEEEIRKIEGEVLTKQEATEMFDDFVKNNDLKNTITLKWSKNFAGRASFYKNTLKLQLPVKHRKNEFLGTLYHELGTHALRRVNHLQQPFFGKKTELGFKDYLLTEEGLASFHGLLAKNFKIDYTGALNYVTCQQAQEKSFVETFAFVNQYLHDKKRAWSYTYRHKRGLYDTQEGGGFTKDMLYFAGLIKVWEYFKKSNFDVASLYWGKIAIEDIEKAKKINPDYQPHLPSFYTQKPDLYQQQIIEIAELNFLYNI